MDKSRKAIRFPCLPIEGSAFLCEWLYNNIKSFYTMSIAYRLSTYLLLFGKFPQIECNDPNLKSMVQKALKTPSWRTLNGSNSLSSNSQLKL